MYFYGNNSIAFSANLCVCSLNTGQFHFQFQKSLMVVHFISNPSNSRFNWKIEIIQIHSPHQHNFRFSCWDWRIPWHGCIKICWTIFQLTYNTASRYAPTSNKGKNMNMRGSRDSQPRHEVFRSGSWGQGQPGPAGPIQPGLKLLSCKRKFGFFSTFPKETGLKFQPKFVFLNIS